MRVTRAVLVFTALAIHLTGCGKGPGQAGSLTIQFPEHAKIWRWQVVKAGSPDKVVQSVTDGTRTVAVPPGDYQVTLQQDEYFSGRVVWPQTIRVKRKQQVAVSVQSGVTLQTPENLPLWRWRVVKAGSPEEVVQWTNGNLKTLLVPPGDYQVTLQQDEYFSGRVVWPAPVRVEPDRQVVVAVQSGVTLQTPENVRLWRWRVVKAGLPEEVVQWTNGNLKTLLVPPGDYQVTLQQDEYFSGGVVWPAPVRVEKDQMTVAALQSGVKITVRAKAKIWRWQVVKAGSLEEVVQWTTGDARTLLVPPGDYQIVIKPEEHQSATVVWPQTGSLTVPDGQLAQAAIDLLTENNTEPSP